MTLYTFTLRIVAAIFLGFIIGFERQLTGHPAGIRTNILVCLGSCLFVLFSLLNDAADQTRVAAQIVTGIGFLGSGIIFKDGVNIRGLTTAATIWCTAAIGMLCSSGHLYYALIASALMIVVNVSLRPISRRIDHYSKPDEEESSYRLSIGCAAGEVKAVRELLITELAQTPLQLVELIDRPDKTGQSQIQARITGYAPHAPKLLEQLLQKINRRPQVLSSGWEVL